MDSLSHDSWLSDEKKGEEKKENKEDPKQEDNFEKMIKKSMANLVEVKRSELGEGHKFFNKALVDKTEKMQAEFDKLMEELQNKRSDHTTSKNFENQMEQFYKKETKQSKHVSPTKRLIRQKTIAVEHKKLMSETLGKHSSNYGLTYVTGDGKSYRVEPKDGKIDYGMAEKNPNKFYENMLQ